MICALRTCPAERASQAARPLRAARQDSSCMAWRADAQQVCPGSRCCRSTTCRRTGRRCARSCWPWRTRSIRRSHAGSRRPAASRAAWSIASSRARPIRYARALRVRSALTTRGRSRPKRSSIGRSKITSSPAVPSGRGSPACVSCPMPRPGKRSSCAWSMAAIPRSRIWERWRAGIRWTGPLPSRRCAASSMA